MKVLTIAILLMSCLEQSGWAASSQEYVPNEEVASKIAEAVLPPIYGLDVLKEKPFHVRAAGEYWVIDGSLPKSSPGQAVVGGVVHMEISRKTGEIKSVMHGK